MTYKIPKTLYTVKDKASDNDLVYMTYADDKDTKAFEKRQTTGRSWARGYRGINHEENFWDNTPQSGVEFVGFASRYSTDNKLIEVKDPRGWVVQIPIGNAVDIIRGSVIDHGVIQDEVVWARYGPNHALISVKSEEYRKILEAKKALPVSLANLKPGDKIEKRRVYLGKFKVACKARYTQSEHRSYMFKSIESHTIDLGETTLHLFVDAYMTKLDDSRHIGAYKAIPKSDGIIEAAFTQEEINSYIQGIKSSSNEKLRIDCVSFERALKDSDEYVGNKLDRSIPRYYYTMNYTIGDRL